MNEFRDEDVLKHAVKAFAETIKLKVGQLRDYVPREASQTNTELTGEFIEELVRGFVRRWIGAKELLHGTFYHEQHVQSAQRPRQIDGIVYDPSKGPVIIREGDFVVVHPAFCAGVLEIKMTCSDLRKLHDRLLEIHRRHVSHLKSYQVMGIVVADRNPETACERCQHGNEVIKYHDHKLAGKCPIFILFKETPDGEYVPHDEGIKHMIQAIYMEIKTTSLYLW